MKNCPNCLFEVKDTYKFCPNCTIKFSEFTKKDANENFNEYCTKCGAIIESDYIFCKKCGCKVEKDTSENKIDKSIKKVKKGFSSIQKEIKESENIENFAESTKKVVIETTEKAISTGNKFLRFLGIIGIIILGLMLLYPIITGKDFVLQSAFESNFSKNYQNYAGFIGEITVPIILPILFIYLGFKNNEKIKGCLLLPLGIGLTLFLFFLMSKCS